MRFRNPERYYGGPGYGNSRYFGERGFYRIPRYEIDRRNGASRRYVDYRRYDDSRLYEDDIEDYPPVINRRRRNTAVLTRNFSGGGSPVRARRPSPRRRGRRSYMDLDTRFADEFSDSEDGYSDSYGSYSDDDSYLDDDSFNRREQEKILYCVYCRSTAGADLSCNCGVISGGRYHKLRTGPRRVKRKSRKLRERIYPPFDSGNPFIPRRQKVSGSMRRVPYGYISADQKRKFRQRCLKFAEEHKYP